MSNLQQRGISQNQDSNNVEMENAGVNQNFMQTNEFLGSNNQAGINQGGDKKDFSNDHFVFASTTRAGIVLHGLLKFFGPRADQS